jgi:hypothetical protein
MFLVPSRSTNNIVRTNMFTNKLDVKYKKIHRRTYLNGNLQAIKLVPNVKNSADFTNIFCVSVNQNRRRRIEHHGWWTVYEWKSRWYLKFAVGKPRLTRNDCSLFLSICSRCLFEIPWCVFTFLNMAPKYSWPLPVKFDQNLWVCAQFQGRDTQICIQWPHKPSWFSRRILRGSVILFSHSQSQSHIATNGQSVCLSWCRAPTGAHDQMFLLVWKLLSCPCGEPSLTRGRVCHLSVIVDSNSLCQYIQIFTSLWLLCNLVYNIYKSSVSPGSVQPTMPSF